VAEVRGLGSGKYPMSTMLLGFNRVENALLGVTRGSQTIARNGRRSPPLKHLSSGKLVRTWSVLKLVQRNLFDCLTLNFTACLVLLAVDTVSCAS
jgi:hypothetical protein